MPGEKRLCVWPGEGKKSFEGVFTAAEQAFRFHSSEIHPIKERPVPIRRGACSCKIDRVTVLAKNLGPVRKSPEYRRTGPLVPLVRGEFPNHARLLLKIINVDDEASSPV